MAEKWDLRVVSLLWRVVGAGDSAAAIVATVLIVVVVVVVLVDRCHLSMALVPLMTVFGSPRKLSSALDRGCSYLSAIAIALE